MEFVIEIEDEKVKGYLMTGTVTFLKEQDGEYFSLPQDAEIVEHDLVDENDESLFDEIENEEGVKEALLKRVLKLSKADDYEDEWDF